MSTGSPQPLEGIKVFDATQGVAGPHGTMLLAQHGAEVTKLEPLDGDWGRTLGRMYGDQCAHGIVFNRGKKSLAMNMKAPEAQRIAFDMAAKADIVVESFRPGVMAKFGIGYDQVKAVNPEVIYLSVTGFGQEGAVQSPARDGFGDPSVLGLDVDQPRRGRHAATDRHDRDST